MPKVSKALPGRLESQGDRGYLTGLFGVRCSSLSDDSPFTGAMGIIASDIRRGMTIIFNGEPCRVIEFHHHTPGNLRAMVQAKMKRLKTGVTLEHRFRASDTIDVADMETHELEFLYRGGDIYHFMNSENYEQLEMDAKALGNDAQWMTEGMKIVAEFFEGRPIGIELPNQLTFEVVETNPVMKSATK